MMKKLLIFSFALFANAFIVSDLSGQQTRPNVILIMTDDQGYADLSCHGNPVLKTPNIDRLYNQSVRLTDFHVTPMCTPTRGELMTGIDAAKNGATNVSSGRTLLDSNLPTMADYFQDNGYSTSIFGKWHLGENYPYTPELRGFQETVWFPSSHISSVPDYWRNDMFDDTYTHNGRKEKFQGYCTDVFFNQAMTWMKNESSKKNKPFFTYLPLNAPHSPWISPEENVKEMEAAMANSSFANMEPVLKNKLIHYLAMIRNIDKNMGRLMDFLDKTGLNENTIVIFTTDNGSYFGNDFFNAGMRGKKTELWEGGHRVPFFIRWPKGKIGAPRDISGLAQVQDVLPTLINLCGLVTKAAPGFDGIDLVPVLKGESNMPDRTLVINYSRMPSGFDYPSPSGPSIMRREGAVVLWQRWRLIEGNQLYDLAADPLQKTDVISKNPEIAAKLKSTLDHWWAKVEPKVNIPVPVIIGNDAANPMLLTSCEWMDVLVDQQAQVLTGAHRNSYWNINVEKEGEYEFELRRWPRESNTALMDADGDGTALPIAVARMYINNEMRRVNVAKKDKAAIFTVKLKPGATTLHTWFCDKANEPICGAYYVYVHRKT